MLGRKKIKKIIFIINCLNVGGTEEQLLYFIKKVKKKFDIKIFSFSGGSLENEFRDQGVVLKCGKNKFLSIFQLIYFLISNPTDVYHFFLPKSYIIGATLPFFSKKKKIMSRRSLNNYHRKYFFISLIIEKFLHQKMDKILTNTISIKKQLITTEGVKSNKIKVIPNLLIKKNKNSLRKKLNKSKIRKFGYVANFIPYKNHLLLIQICSLIKANKDWKLYLIGSDNNGYKNILKKKVKALGLEKKIYFFNQTRNISEFYNKIDFSVSSSSEEGSSNFLLESITFGLPIIAFNVGGNFEFFQNNGFLIPTFDKISMKNAIEHMINNDLKIYSKNSIKVCNNKFNNKKNFQILSSQY